jgi:hypothetical protein
MTDEEAKAVVGILVRAHGGQCMACAGALLSSFNTRFPGFAFNIIDPVWEKHFRLEWGKNWIDWTETNLTCPRHPYERN